ncbi:MAG: (Fe-S)-binding protein [Candidatus Methanospirareceae archaeon]
METVTGESFGEKYDLFACIQCGKCTGSCPISLKSPLNARKVVRESLLFDNSVMYGRSEIWDCTTCSTCKLRCPRELSAVDVIIGIRGFLVEEGKVPTTVRDALDSVFKNGNPWGRIRAKRSEWTEEIKEEYKIKDFSKGEKAEILYYVGCTPAYDTRVQEVARALVKLFHAANVDFGILGNEETCCGNEVRRMGEEGLFEILVEDNIGLFEKYGISKIVTTSPHCYNVFKNEYEGLEAEIMHYTQFFSDLIDKDKIKFSKELNKRVTYQDPCFLGKQNKVYDEPRKLIESMKGVEFVEMDRAKERSLCCEGGGGRMWVESEAGGGRTAEIRVQEAAELGVDIIFTSCPFCLLTFEDAVKTTGYEGKIEVKDISEVLAELL